MHALVVSDGTGESQVILLNDEVEVEPWLLTHPQFDGLLYTSIVVDARLAGRLPDEFPWTDLETGPLLAADGAFIRAEQHHILNGDRNPVPTKE